MAMDQMETFEWLRQRSERVEELLIENAKLRAQVAELVLENAYLTTAKQREREAKAEQIDGEILNMVLK